MTTPNPLDLLLERTALGDQKAFGQFYTELAPRVFGRILYVLRDRAQAEEVMQDVFLEIWQQAKRFTPERGGANGWVMARAHARAVDRVRSAQASRERDRRIGARDLSPNNDPVAEVIELRVDAARVRASLASLTPLQREAITLAHFEGYSHSEIAELLQVPIGTVKSRLHGAFTNLRQVLAVAS
jgi:RNA polymerase sigma-70 factor (ECF subfamily)